MLDANLFSDFLHLLHLTFVPEYLMIELSRDATSRLDDVRAELGTSLGPNMDRANALAERRAM
jgi:hypothetical protein